MILIKKVDLYYLLLYCVLVVQQPLKYGFYNFKNMNYRVPMTTSVFYVYVYFMYVIYIYVHFLTREI